MIWEIQRHDWSQLRADRIPEALYALLRAKTEKEATDAHTIIDATAVVEGALYEAAVPTTACLLSVLQGCLPVARPHVLEILVQLGTGEPAQSETMAGAQKLQQRCQDELCKGVAIYLSILESGSDKERTFCVDLLGLCGQRDASLVPRIVWYYEKLLTEPVGEGLKDLTATWLRAVRGIR
jgi:hypothetical protein